MRPFQSLLNDDRKKVKFTYSNFFRKFGMLIKNWAAKTYFFFHSTGWYWISFANNAKCRHWQYIFTAPCIETCLFFIVLYLQHPSTANKASIKFGKTLECMQKWGIGDHQKNHVIKITTLIFVQIKIKAPYFKKTQMFFLSFFPS